MCRSQATTTRLVHRCRISITVGFSYSAKMYRWGNVDRSTYSSDGRATLGYVSTSSVLYQNDLRQIFVRRARSNVRCCWRSIDPTHAASLSISRGRASGAVDADRFHSIRPTRLIVTTRTPQHMSSLNHCESEVASNI